jgi:hypothetical protein
MFVVEEPLCQKIIGHQMCMKQPHRIHLCLAGCDTSNTSLEIAIFIIYLSMCKPSNSESLVAIGIHKVPGGMFSRELQLQTRQQTLQVAQEWLQVQRCFTVKRALGNNLEASL